MTREEAIEFGNIWLQINEDCKDSSTYAFFEMAIRSFEAWDKVINTLKNWSDAKVSPKQRDLYFDCIELIEQTIKRGISESEGKE